MSLAVRELRARYGPIEVCRDITFDCAAGELLCVLGPNGAGKSSLLGAIAGIVASTGDVLVGETNLAPLSPSARARSGIALVPEGRRNLFGAMTVAENLRLALRLLPSPGRDAMRTELHAMFPILEQRASQPAALLSGGEQQMLAIAAAIGRKPSVLLLDEPSQGLAPVALDALVDAIAHLRRAGLAIVLAEQNHAFAARLADRYVVLQGGEFTGGGSAAQLADREHAAAAILGR